MLRGRGQFCRAGALARRAGTWTVGTVAGMQRWNLVKHVEKRWNRFIYIYISRRYHVDPCSKLNLTEHCQLIRDDQGPYTLVWRLSHTCEGPFMAMRVPSPMTTYANRESISNPRLWTYDNILCHIPCKKIILLYSVARLDYTIASYASSGWGIDSFKCPGSPPVIQNFPSRLERCLAFKMQCRWPRTTCKIVTSKPEKLADGLIRSPPGIHAPVRWFLCVTYSG